MSWLILIGTILCLLMITFCIVVNLYKRYLDKMTIKEIENGNKDVHYHNHKIFDMNKYIMLVSFILLVVIGLLNLYLN
jgi:multisubunit Na+/H+ antiporter MnhB subunit